MEKIFDEEIVCVLFRNVGLNNLQCNDLREFDLKDLREEKK